MFLPQKKSHSRIFLGRWGGLRDLAFCESRSLALDSDANCWKLLLFSAYTLENFHNPKSKPALSAIVYWKFSFNVRSYDIAAKFSYNIVCSRLLHSLLRNPEITKLDTQNWRGKKLNRRGIGGNYFYTKRHIFDNKLTNEDWFTSWRLPKILRFPYPSILQCQYRFTSGICTVDNSRLYETQSSKKLKWSSMWFLAVLK